jgi:hypothetical protein
MFAAVNLSTEADVHENETRHKEKHGRTEVD